MSTATSNRSRRLTGAVIAVIVIAVVFGLRFNQLGQGSALASIRSVQESEGLPVETVTVERGDLSRWLTLAGTVEGAIQYPVVSQNALQVLSVEVGEGDVVAAGDVVLRLAGNAPSPMYHSLDKSRAGYDNARRDAERMRNLFAEGAVSRSQLDAAETQLEVAAADLNNAEGSTALVAAEGGVVSSILVTAGESTPVNKPLVWIIRTDTVKLCFDAGSSQAMSLAVDQPARWLLPDGTTGGEGFISQLDLMADPSSHLLSGEASFANPDGRLVPGLLVSFSVQTMNHADVMTVPSACLVSNGGGNAVWTVVDQQGELRAALRTVETGERDSDKTEILHGLNEGDLVVRYGQTQLSEGILARRIDQTEER